MGGGKESYEDRKALARSTLFQLPILEISELGKFQFSYVI
jgi:hypothetical protein